MKLTITLALLTCFGTQLAFGEPGQGGAAIDGISLGISRDEADSTQSSNGKKLVYSGGSYWYRKPSGPMSFSPRIVFGPDGKICRVSGDELKIDGVSYKAGDHPYALKMSLGLPDSDKTFKESGNIVREWIYNRQHLAVRLRTGHRDRIECFILDADPQSVFVNTSRNGTTASSLRPRN